MKDFTGGGIRVSGVPGETPAEQLAHRRHEAERAIAALGLSPEIEKCLRDIKSEVEAAHKEAIADAERRAREAEARIAVIQAGFDAMDLGDTGDGLRRIWAALDVSAGKRLLAEVEALREVERVAHSHVAIVNYLDDGGEECTGCGAVVDNDTRKRGGDIAHEVDCWCRMLCEAIDAVEKARRA